MNISINLKGLPENITIGELKKIEEDFEKLAKLRPEVKEKQKPKEKTKSVDEILKELENEK